MPVAIIRFPMVACMSWHAWSPVPVRVQVPVARHWGLQIFLTGSEGTLIIILACAITCSMTLLV